MNFRKTMTAVVLTACAASLTLPALAQDAAPEGAPAQDVAPQGAPAPMVEPGANPGAGRGPGAAGNGAIGSVPAARVDPLALRAGLGLFRFDADQDGILSAEEIEAGRTAEAAALDADGDGLVSAEELVAYELNLVRPAIEARVAARIAAYDRDGDGLLSAAELALRPMPADIVERLTGDAESSLVRDELEAMRDAIRADARDARRTGHGFGRPDARPGPEGSSRHERGQDHGRRDVRERDAGRGGDRMNPGWQEREQRGRGPADLDRRTPWQGAPGGTGPARIVPGGLGEGQLGQGQLGQAPERRDAMPRQQGN